MQLLCLSPLEVGGLNLGMELKTSIYLVPGNIVYQVLVLLSENTTAVRSRGHYIYTVFVQRRYSSTTAVVLYTWLTLRNISNFQQKFRCRCSRTHCCLI